MDTASIEYLALQLLSPARDVGRSEHLGGFSRRRAGEAPPARRRVLPHQGRALPGRLPQIRGRQHTRAAPEGGGHGGPRHPGEGLGEMAYDIEGCVDAFTHRLGGGDEPHGQGGIKEFLGKCARFLLALRSRHQFANQIDELKSRLVEVGERRERYKLDDLDCGNSGRMVVDPRLSALFANEDQLVGIDGPRDDLAKWMVEVERGLAKHRKVLSIVGFGGLGKTTLANEVYRKIGGKFQCKAFVSVSQKPDMNKILRDFLLQLANHEQEDIKILAHGMKRKSLKR